MSHAIITGHNHIFGPWVAERLGTTWTADRGHTIGLVGGGRIPRILAVAWFESHNGASILCHLAGVGKKWLNREFLWYICYYPFEQLGVNKVISPVESDNLDSVKFVEHFGMTLEATLKEAAPKGDLLLYTLTREQCKWLHLRKKQHGQAQSSSTT